MENLNYIATKLIKPAVFVSALKYPDGNTEDIITEIVNTDKISQGDTAAFAPYMRGVNTFETLSKIWHFVKKNIKYKLDEFGYQYVKTPSRTWSDKYADCKSYSIFIASLLKNLQIPFYYRFVSFYQNGEYTHVYIVVPLNGKLVIMDDVMPAFNTEKPFAKKYDIDMTKIYQLSGIGLAPQTKLINLGSKDLSQITEGEMDLLIARDRLETEKAIVDRKKGIGSLMAEKYNDSISMINDAICAVNDYQLGRIDDIDVELGLIAGQATSGAYSIANSICGIGDINGKKVARIQHRTKLKTKRASLTRRLTPSQKQNIWGTPSISGPSNNATVGFLKKVAAKVKKATKAAVKVAKKTTKTAVKVAKKTAKGAVKVAKVVATAAIKVATLPMRLAIKGILEVSLPKAAPFFLYLFITDPKALAKAPASVRTKRKKAEKVANFIVNIIGMKRPHFMGIVRNGIMKKYGKSPENVLGDMAKGISGIGVLPLVAISAIIGIVTQLAKLFKKKAEPVSANDAPDESDFAASKPDELKAFAQDIKAQPENVSAFNTDSENPELPVSNAVTSPSATEMKETQKFAKSTKAPSYGQSSSSTQNDSGDSQDENIQTQSNTTAQAAQNAQDMSSGGRKVWSSI